MMADPCAYCGRPSTVMDHLHPRSRGGADHAGNLLPACRSCNAEKGRRSLLPFLVARAHRYSMRAPFRDNDEEGVTVRGAARLLGISTQRVHQLLATGMFATRNTTAGFLLSRSDVAARSQMIRCRRIRVPSE